MRHTPDYLLEDVEEVKRLIRDNPWGTFVSATSHGLIASHYPVVLEEDVEGISIVSHVGRPDDTLHELGQHELLLIIQGPHGYISPSWYPDPHDVIPTWNHVTAHLYGQPEVLDPETNFEVLRDLVDHFEAPMPEPRALSTGEEMNRAVSRGTVGLRLRVDRFDARLKLSQNRPESVREGITAELRGDGPYAQPALADEMDRVDGVSDE